MEWLLAGLAALVIYKWGEHRDWWPSLFGPPKKFTCDLETDMPEAIKQSVLATLGTSKDPAALNQLAQTMLMAGYVSAAYCLKCRAAQLAGTAPPPAPTQADIAGAQAIRAAAQLAAAGAQSAVAAAAANPPPGTSQSRAEASENV